MKPISLRYLKQEIKNRNTAMQAKLPSKIWKKQLSFTLFNEQTIIDPLFRNQLTQLKQKRFLNQITETQLEHQAFQLLNESIKRIKKSNLS